MTYVASAPTEAAAAGNAYVTQVLSTHTSTGWVSRDLSLPHAQATAFSEHPQYPLFSTDLSLAAAQPLGGFVPCTAEGSGPACLSVEATEQTPYVRSDFVGGNREALCVSSPGTGCYRPLVSAANVPAGVEFGVAEGGPAGGTRVCPPMPFCGPQVEAASPDLTHVVVNSRPNSSKAPENPRRPV